MVERRKFPWTPLLLALLLSIPLLDAARAEVPGVAAPALPERFDPSRGAVLFAEERARGSFLWSFREPTDFRPESGRTMVHYLVQPLDGSKPPRQVHAGIERGGGEGIGTLLPDGSVLLAIGDHLVWAAEGAPERMEDLPAIHGSGIGINAVFPQGVVAEEYRFDGGRPTTWWVPINDHHLKLDAPIKLDEGLDRGAPFLRQGNTIGWIHAPPTGRERRQTTFGLLDINSGAVRHTPIHVPPASQLCAFDGVHGILLDGIANAATGTVISINWPGQPFALLHDHVYCLGGFYASDGIRPRELDVLELPLDGKGEPRKIAQLNLESGQGGSGGTAYPMNCVLLVGDALWTWDGTRRSPAPGERG